MASNYQDKISTIDHHLTLSVDARVKNKVDFEYHVILNNDIDFDFDDVFWALKQDKDNTLNNFTETEEQIEERFDDITQNLKEDIEIMEMSVDFFNGYEPFHEIENFVNTYLKPFHDQWRSFLNQYKNDHQELEQMSQSFGYDEDTFNNIQTASFIDNYDELCQNMRRKITHLNEIISAYNNLIEDKTKAERNIDFYQEKLNEAEPDDDDYRHLEQDIEDAKDDYESIATKLKDKKHDLEHEANYLLSEYQRIKEASKKMEEHLSDVFEDIENDREYAIELLKTHRPELGKTQNEQAILYQNTKNSLEGFVSQLKHNDNIEDEIIIDNKSYELNHLVIFKDYSMAFKNNQGEFFLPLVKHNRINGDSKALPHNTESILAKPFQPEEDSFIGLKSFMHNIIGHEFRKTPKYKNAFSHFVEEQCFEPNNNAIFTEIMDTINKVKTYEHALKNNQFDIDSFVSNKKKNKFEAFSDKLESLIKEHQVNKMVNNFFSQKYKPLINEQTYQYFHLLVENNIDKDTIKDQLIDKLAAYKTSDEFNTALRRLSHALIDWSPEAIEKKRQAVNSQTIYQEDDKMIVKVDDFQACQELGSPNWCISRTSNFFDSYQKKGEQYIVYDFTKEPKEPESMIGLTINPTQGLTNAHLKNDRSTGKTEQALNIATITLHNDSIEPPVIHESIKTLSQERDTLQYFLETHKETIQSKPDISQVINNALEEHAPDFQSIIKIDHQKRPIAKPN